MGGRWAAELPQSIPATGSSPDLASLSFNALFADAAAGSAAVDAFEFDSSDPKSFSLLGGDAAVTDQGYAPQKIQTFLNAMVAYISVFF